MSFDPSIGDAFRRGAARAGTVVWLLAGIVLLGATIDAQWLSPAAAARAAAAASPGGDRAASAYHPSGAFSGGEEVVLVFVGASFCNAHNVPGFPEVVETAKVRLAAQAAAARVHFRAVGVALDWSPAEGLAFLARFGEFDEVAAGSNWIGDGATKYVWRDLPGEPDVPQLLVLRRTVETGTSIRVGEDRIVRRIRGVTAIADWVAGGAEL